MKKYIYIGKYFTRATYSKMEENEDKNEKSEKADKVTTMIDH